MSKQLVYIAGSGHSGSTLLNLILGSHSKIAALGEVHRLSWSASSDDYAHKCYCGQSIIKCSAWNKVMKKLNKMMNSSNQNILQEMITTDPQQLIFSNEELMQMKAKLKGKYYFSTNRLAMIMGSKIMWKILTFISKDTKTHYKIIENSLLIYDCVREVWNKPIIVDCTKNPARLKGLYMKNKHPFKVLYLVRDGRAVCFSRMKREEISMEKCAKIWKREYYKHKITQLTIAKKSILLIHYENLCRNPKQEIQKICQFLNIKYEEGVLNFRTSEIHGIGGNTMRFRTQEDQIVLDEKWKDQISKEDLQIFQQIAGKINSKYGYT